MSVKEKRKKGKEIFFFSLRLKLHEQTGELTRDSGGCWTARWRLSWLQYIRSGRGLALSGVRDYGASTAALTSVPMASVPGHNVCP